LQAKKPAILDIFRRIRNLAATLTANVFGMNHNIDNRRRALQTTKGPVQCPKSSWTSVYKWLKIGPEFLSTFNIPLHFQSIAHALSAINVAPHSESKQNGIRFVWSSDAKSQKILTWQ